MNGRRSLDSDLTPLDADITRTERRLRVTRRQALTRCQTTWSRRQATNTSSTPPMGDQDKMLKEHYVPSSFTNASPIKLPTVTAAHFEIKAHILNSTPKFHGFPTENPYAHINELISLCSTFRMLGVTDDALMLRLFPFSLKEKAKEWFDSLPPNSIETWAQMESVFLFKYFPPAKTTQFRRAISTFNYLDGETFHECWDRFNDLLRKCPHHKIDKYQLIQYFYEGLDEKYRTLIDASCGGAVMNKKQDEAWALFTVLAENSLLQVRSTRDYPSQTAKKGGVYEVTPTTDFTVKMDTMCRQMDQLMQRESQRASPTPSVCEVCSVGGHVAQDCPMWNECQDMGVEHVNAVNPRNDPYSNNFNPGWARHPNFGWKQPEQHGFYGQNNHPQPPYPRGPPQPTPYQAPHQRSSYQGNIQPPQQYRAPYYPTNNTSNWQPPNNNQNQNFGSQPKTKMVS